MIRNGSPYTNENGWEDAGLITDHPQEEQDIVLDWIRRKILPRKTVLHGRTSYGMKHILDSKTQKGAYKILDNAKKCANQNPGYKVFDADGKIVYEPKTAEPAVKVPFLVKVSISDLNIRTGPGTDYGRVQFCPVGVYTIMEVKAGQGSKAGWGRLKSGIGFISLDYVQKL